MTNSMRVKVIKSFLSPLNNRLAKVDSEMNVPKSQFWYKRAEQGDIKILKEKIEKKKAKAEIKKPEAQPKKGSK